MVDPFACLGIASSIVQLVDFSARLVKEIAEIRKKGGTKDQLYLWRATIEFDETANNIRRSLASINAQTPTDSTSATTLSKDEQVSVLPAPKCLPASMTDP